MDDSIAHLQCPAFSVPHDAITVPKFVVSLDDPPETRWNHVVVPYREHFAAIDKEVNDLLRDEVGATLGPMLVSAASALMSSVKKMGLVFYGRELEGIATAMGLPLGRVILIQMVYEVSACCTSIVVPSSSGVPMHARSMDWGMDFLRPLTIEVEFQSMGRPVMSCVTWAGCVGVLTGMRHGAYSVSVNYRHTGGSLASNLTRALTRGWPIAFLLREVLESTANFDTAVAWLSHSSIIAPVYYTCCATSSASSPGVLITRNREGSERPWAVKELGPIVQTNIDWWSEAEEEDIMDSIQRRSLARQWIQENMLSGIDEQKLWTLMTRPPYICNSLTIYACVMVPEFGVMHIRLPDTRRHPLHPFVPAGPSAQLSLSPVRPFDARAARDQVRERPAAALAQSGAGDEEVNLTPEEAKVAALAGESPRPLSPLSSRAAAVVDAPMLGAAAAAASSSSSSSSSSSVGSPLMRPVICTACGRTFGLGDTSTGACAHRGTWHSALSDCNVFRCGLGLKTNVGFQHWSCCFATEYNTSCPKSGAHTAPPPAAPGSDQ